MGDIEQLCQVIEEKEKFIQDKERTGFILLLYILKGNHTVPMRKFALNWKPNSQAYGWNMKMPKEMLEAALSSWY